MDDFHYLDTTGDVPLTGNWKRIMPGVWEFWIAGCERYDGRYDALT
jgi:hypothetical protein